MGTLRTLFLSFVFTLPGAVQSAPITVNPGDTIGVKFKFTEPFQAPPNIMDWNITPVTPLPVGSNWDANFNLYNGATQLESIGTGSGPTQFASFAIANDIPPSGCSNPACIDFTSIRNRTIDGRWTSTLIAGSPSLTFDPKSPGTVSILTGVSGGIVPPTFANISSIIVNNLAVYTEPAAFDTHYSPNAPFACNGLFFSKRCPGYDYSFDGNSLTISLDIGLKGSPNASLTKTWEQGIEQYWGSNLFGERYDILDGPNKYPIYFDVNFVSGFDPFADLYVNVVDGVGRDNTQTWYTTVQGWGNDFQDEAAAHEFGHYLGLYDEYKDGLLGPFGLHCDTSKPLSDPANANCDGLMGDLRRPTLERYYEQILTNFANKTGQSVFLASSPFPPPEQSFSNYVGEFGEDLAVVPEPATLGLLSLGLAGLAASRRRKQ